jgi:hypothetical protein
MRLKGSETHPSNAKEIGFDPGSVNTVLLIGLKLAGVAVHRPTNETGTSEEPPWS